MKKLVIITLVVLLVAIVGVAVFFYNSIDSIVKSAIEKYGSEISGTKVTVGSVDISLKSGRGTVRDVKVHNPEGFSDERAFRLGEVTLDLDVSSLNKDPIVIEEVTVRSPEVRAELAADGRSNLDVIKDHADRYRAGSAATRKQEAGFEKKFRITKFVFEEGRLEGDASAVGAGSVEATLPAVRLNDVGGARGVPPDEIGRTITRGLLESATATAKREVSRRAAGKLENEAKKALEKILN